MVDAIVKLFGHVLEFVKSPRLCAGILLASFALLLVPESFLKAHEMEAVLKYRGWAIVPILLCGAILLTELGLVIWRVAVRKFESRSLKRQIALDIPYLTATDKEIIGYLLHHHQKTFTYAPDGGYASALIGKGYIVRAMVHGQIAAHWEVPFAVPDEAWEVFSKHKDSFQYKEPECGKATFPWAIPWQLR